MKKNKIIYWISTSIIATMMLFSAFGYFVNPEMKAAFDHLGFPGFFRIELGVLKILGAFVLLIPIIPGRVKEFAYFGFTLTFISAVIAHVSSGDPISRIISPAIFLLTLVVSFVFFGKTHGKE